MNVPSPVRLASPARPRFQLRTGALDASALARAEAALNSLSSQFAGWLRDEVGKLEAACGAVRTQGMTRETGDALYSRAHDLKGLGGTYQFPIVTRLAGSLCKLLDDPARRATVPARLIDAHVEAIQAVVRDNVTSDEDPIGRTLAEALEEQVAAYRSPDSGSTTAP